MVVVDGIGTGWCGYVFTRGGSINQSINRLLKSQDQPQVSIAIDGVQKKETDVCGVRVWVCVVLCFALGGGQGEA